MQRPSGTDEDGRDGKQLPHAEREGAAGADHNSTLRQSCFLDCVCVCECVCQCALTPQGSRINVPLVNQVLFKGLFEIQFLNLPP